MPPRSSASTCRPMPNRFWPVRPPSHWPMGRDVTFPRSELGLRADKSFAVQDAVLTLRGRTAWAHDYYVTAASPPLSKRFRFRHSSSTAQAQGHNSALASASAELKWVSGWSVAATFDGEFSDVTRSYSGKGVVRYTW